MFGFSVFLQSVSCHWSADPVSLNPIYSPPVVFNGIINGETVELRGRIAQPNTCTLQNDTVAVFMCSEDYSPGEYPKGRYLRVLILPFAGDSTDTLARQRLETENLVVKLGDHVRGTTQSFQVTPSDESRKGRHAKAEIGSLQRRRGASLRLTDFDASAGAVFGSSAIETMSITMGTIEGTIQ